MTCTLTSRKSLEALTVQPFLRPCYRQEAGVILLDRSKNLSYAHGTRSRVHVMASQTSAVIVNWNGAPFLEALLRSLKESKVHSIIVVDNASSDQSREILASQDDVSVIWNQENRGFGVAANQGIVQSDTPYVLVLNADVQILPGSIELLEWFLQENPSAGLVAPQLLHPNGKVQLSCRRFPTTTGIFLYLSYLDRIIPNPYRLKEQEHHIIGEVDQPMGAALMFRRSTLDEVGMFDPRFFLYMEDVDLCERIKTQGWKIYFFPQARMLHYAGGSANQDWERTQWDFYESIFRYFQKSSSNKKSITLKIVLASALIIRSTLLLFAGQLKKSKFYLSMLRRIFSLS